MGNRLYVGNLSYNTTESELRAAFAQKTLLKLRIGQGEHLERHLPVQRVLHCETDSRHAAHAEALFDGVAGYLQRGR